ncbi:MAG: AtpZ/AtpI family protein [Planctomycetaceae bacterium]
MASSDNNRDGRSSAARGYVLASRVTSISIQMALPPGVGWWLDERFSTSPWLMIVGVLLGFSVAMLELLKFAKEKP